MLQVTLTVDVTAGTTILPAGLLGHEPASEGSKSIGHGIGACLVLSVPELQMHLRLHDHFMGSLHPSPILLSPSNSFSRDVS